VHDVLIYCECTVGDVENLVLVDLPGAGEAARNGTRERTAIDLTDFRGGAAFDMTRGKESDTAALWPRTGLPGAARLGHHADHLLVALASAG
jgi:hypothetical protein